PAAWGHRVAHGGGRGTDVDAGLRELGVVGVDVVRLQADTGWAIADRIARPRWAERDRGRLVSEADLDPAVALAERHVDALLEAELLDVELDRAVLVGDGNEHRRNLAHAGLGDAA